MVMAEIETAVAGRPDADDLIEEMLSLGPWSGCPTASVAGCRGGGRPVKFGIFYEHQLPRPWDPAASSA